MNKLKNIPLVYTEEVSDALNEGTPIVALESNVITHGLKYPDNAVTASSVENAVRKGGAIPATIGIDEGKILVGMSTSDIERFATSENIPKVSNRDVPVILSKRIKGATTVASSVLLAELANIKFFASAGIGGVHRGAEKTMDISADLIQFTRSNLAVVCAGAKNILDLNLTLEYLETQGIPIISYQFDDFPAFYCKSSNVPSPHRMDEILQIAQAIDNHWVLNNQNSILITKPINDEDAINQKEVEAIIDQAIIRAEQEKITGNNITKFIMRSIDRHTKGRTSNANMSVLISTAEFAGKLAASHAQLAQLESLTQ